MLSMSIEDLRKKECLLVLSQFESGRKGWTSKSFNTSVIKCVLSLGRGVTLEVIILFSQVKVVGRHQTAKSQKWNEQVFFVLQGVSDSVP
jgi:hypothetical protein